MDKIAIIVDSGCDIPIEMQDRDDIFIAPLKIIFKDNEYRDGVDITSEELYEKLKTEIPKTSLPSGEDMIEILDKAYEKGFNKAIFIAISSGLSGTYAMANLVSTDYEKIEMKAIDTKNIGIGAGFIAFLAAKLKDGGKNYNEIIQLLNENLKNSKVYFAVDTLEYLQKGGRIGLVSAIIGKGINLKPIISCNDDGIYYTAAKVIGKGKSHKKIIDLVEKFASNFEECNVCITHGNALNDANLVKEEILRRIPQVKYITLNQVSSTLAVHTGPGLMGIGVQKA